MIQTCLVASVTFTLVRRHAVSMLTFLLTDGHTLTEGLVALIAQVAVTFLRRYTLPIGAVNAAQWFTNALTSISESIALHTQADIR